MLLLLLILLLTLQQELDQVGRVQGYFLAVLYDSHWHSGIQPGCTAAATFVVLEIQGHDLILKIGRRVER